MKKILLSLIIFLSMFCLLGCKNEYDLAAPSSYRLLEDGTYAAECDVIAPYYTKGLCLEIPSKYKGKKVTRLDSIWGDYKAIRKIIISKNITYIYESDLYKLDNLSEIEVSRQNKKYSSLDGVLYSKYMIELIYCPKAIEGKIRFPLLLRKIREKAFYESRTLSSIQIPQTVTEIGEYAFFRCGRLETVSFHEDCRITEIDNSTFEDCKALWSITLPKSIKIIGSRAFESCNNLKTVDFNGKSQLEEIQWYAFSYCISLEEIYIANTLKSIENGAFYNCKNLKVIHYNGTVEQWEGIEIENNNDYLNSADVYINH